MSTATPVPLEEYLSTTYEPDCDYVDGELEDRNVGEKSHGKVQKRLIVFFSQREAQLGVYAIQEQRVQVSSHRFRVPDFCVTLGPEPSEEIFKSPPFVCIEILSPKDRLPRMQRKIQDYLAFGVHYVWVLDPYTKSAFVYTSSGFYEVRDGVLRTENPEIVVPLSELFE